MPAHPDTPTLPNFTAPLTEADFNLVMAQTDLCLRLSSDGAIVVATQETPAADVHYIELAQLEKTDTIWHPSLLIMTQAFENDELARKAQNDLKEWLSQTVTDRLSAILSLENLDHPSAAVRALTYRLFEAGGLMYRHMLRDQIKPLTPEDRRALRTLGIQLGAHYVFLRDLLKPKPLALKAVLWRLWYNKTPKQTPLPHDGNVSMAISDKASTAFYRDMGYPVYGGSMVRVDMIERINSHVFDQAVTGIWRFDPAVASTIGVSTETLQAIFEDLGFRPEWRDAEPMQDRADAFVMEESENVDDDTDNTDNITFAQESVIPTSTRQVEVVPELIPPELRAALEASKKAQAEMADNAGDTEKTSKEATISPEETSDAPAENVVDTEENAKVLYYHLKKRTIKPLRQNNDGKAQHKNKNARDNKDKKSPRKDRHKNAGGSKFSGSRKSTGNRLADHIDDENNPFAALKKLRTKE